MQLNKRFDVAGMNDFDLMTQLADLPSPVMGSAASLHGDQRLGLLNQIAQQLIAFDLFAAEFFTVWIVDVNLENVFRQIDANCIKLVHDGLTFLDAELSDAGFHPASWHKGGGSISFHTGFYDCMSRALASVRAGH